MQAERKSSLLEFAEAPPKISHKILRILCGNSSVGRAQPCQGWGRESESRFPLSLKKAARMVESVDTRDLKSLGHCGCVGSSPTPGTQEGTRKALIFRAFSFVCLWIYFSALANNACSASSTFSKWKPARTSFINCCISALQRLPMLPSWMWCTSLSCVNSPRSNSSPTCL